MNDERAKRYDRTKKFERKPVTESQYTKRSMSPARRARILRRDGFKCCRCPDTFGPFIVDHISPLWISGNDDDDNLWTLCETCNKNKTANDIKAIAKSKRILGITKTGPKKKIQSRGFDTRFKKKLNGNVVLVG